MLHYRPTDVPAEDYARKSSFSKKQMEMAVSITAYQRILIKNFFEMM